MMVFSDSVVHSVAGRGEWVYVCIYLQCTAVYYYYVKGRILSCNGMLLTKKHRVKFARYFSHYSANEAYVKKMHRCLRRYVKIKTLTELVITLCMKTGAFCFSFYVCNKRKKISMFPHSSNYYLLSILFRETND